MWHQGAGDREAAAVANGNGQLYIHVWWIEMGETAFERGCSAPGQNEQLRGPALGKRKPHNLGL